MALAAVCAYAVFMTLFPGPSWESVERMVPDAPRQVAQSLFRELGSGNVDAVVQLMHPDIRAQFNAREEVARMLPFFSDLSEGDIRFGSWNYYASSNAPAQHHRLA